MGIGMLVLIRLFSLLWKISLGSVCMVVSVWVFC